MNEFLLRFIGERDQKVVKQLEDELSKGHSSVLVDIKGALKLIETLARTRNRMCDLEIIVEACEPNHPILEELGE